MTTSILGPLGSGVKFMVDALEWEHLRRSLAGKIKFPERFALFDLTWWDRVVGKRPTQRVLAEEWGWGKTSVQRLLTAYESGAVWVTKDQEESTPGPTEEGSSSDILARWTRTDPDPIARSQPPVFAESRWSTAGPDTPDVDQPIGFRPHTSEARGPDSGPGWSTPSNSSPRNHARGNAETEGNPRQNTQRADPENTPTADVCLVLRSRSSQKNNTQQAGAPAGQAEREGMKAGAAAPPPSAPTDRQTVHDRKRTRAVAIFEHWHRFHPEIRKPEAHVDVLLGKFAQLAKLTENGETLETEAKLIVDYFHLAPRTKWHRENKLTGISTLFDTSKWLDRLVLARAWEAAGRPEPLRHESLAQAGWELLLKLTKERSRLPVDLAHAAGEAATKAFWKALKAIGGESYFRDTREGQENTHRQPFFEAFSAAYEELALGRAA